MPEPIRRVKRAQLTRGRRSSPADRRGPRDRGSARGARGSLIPRWGAVLAANGIDVAGVEFIVDEAGRPFTYDLNTNTNYNSEAEAKDGRRGMGETARYLGRLLAEARQAPVLLRTAG